MVKKEVTTKEKKAVAAKTPKKEVAAKSVVLFDEDKKVSVKPAVTDVKASLRYFRYSSRKVKLVIDEVRGLFVNEAEHRLQLINKGSSLAVLKLLRSAIANAENNFKLKREDLFIRKIIANEGPTLKRWQPAAFGRANPIRENTCHIEIVLGVKPEAVVKKQESKKSIKQIKDKTVNKKEEII